MCSWLLLKYLSAPPMAEHNILIVRSYWKRRKMWNKRRQANWIFKQSCPLCIRNGFSPFWRKERCLIFGQERRGVATKRQASYIFDRARAVRRVRLRPGKKYKKIDPLNSCYGTSNRLFKSSKTFQRGREEIRKAVVIPLNSLQALTLN